MVVKDIAELAKLSFLTNLVVARNDDALIKFTYLGVSELYRRFNLSIKVETILTNPDLALYELRSKDVNQLLTLYDSKSKELTQTDVMGGRDYDYKMMNYRSFILTRPRTDMLFAMYKASPKNLTSLDDEIELPDAMIEALLTYVAYIGHGTINKDNINESSAYSQRFDAACRELDNQGYRVPLSTETFSVHLKGYV